MTTRQEIGVLAFIALAVIVVVNLGGSRSSRPRAATIDAHPLIYSGQAWRVRDDKRALACSTGAAYNRMKQLAREADGSAERFLFDPENGCKRIASGTELIVEAAEDDDGVVQVRERGSPHRLYLAPWMLTGDAVQVR